MIQTIITIAVSALVSLGLISVAPVKEAPLGTGSNIQYTGSLIPTRDDFWTLGTTSAAYKSANINSLTVSSCTGCSAASSADLQDSYNSSGADAQITHANTKDTIFFLPDTATDPNLIINIDTASGGKLLVQNSSSGAGTTTVASIDQAGLITGTSFSGSSSSATSTINGGFDILGDVSVGSAANTMDINGATIREALQLHVMGNDLQGGVSIHRHADTAARDAVIDLARARGNAEGAESVVSSGDGIGTIGFSAFDGTDFAQAARLEVDVDGTPGSDDMPGRFIFSTSPDGMQTVSEVLRLDSLQGAGIASSTISSGTRLAVNGILATDILHAEDVVKSGYFIATSTTASSTFQGISIGAVGGLSSASGLTISGGDLLLSGKLVQSLSSATSSLTSGLNASSSIAVSGRIAATPSHSVCQSSGIINWSSGNGACINVSADTTISSDGKQLPNQVLRLWITHNAAYTNIAWASSTFLFLGTGAATTTSDAINATDICTLTAGPTSTNPIAVSCSGPYFSK